MSRMRQRLRGGSIALAAAVGIHVSIFANDATASPAQQAQILYSDDSDPNYVPEYDPSHFQPVDPPPGFLDDDPLVIEEPDESEMSTDIDGDASPLDP